MEELDTPQGSKLGCFAGRETPQFVELDRSQELQFTGKLSIRHFEELRNALWIGDRRFFQYLYFSIPSSGEIIAHFGSPDKL